jgi:hypothetical protein
VVDVVDPLVVNLRVSEFVYAFYVVYGFLVDLFLIEEPSSCVVGELAQKVLGVVGVASCLVVWVRVGCRVVFV